METFIREKKLRNEPIKIANIYGHSAIVQHDFNEGLNISSGEFKITDFTCNITSATSILQKLQELKPLQFDIIALFAAVETARALMYSVMWILPMNLLTLKSFTEPL